MKKFIALMVMAAVLMGGVVGCGDKDKDKKKTGTGSGTASGTKSGS